MQELPDLILMDVQLPKMSGLDATRMLKADPARAHIPIIVITSFALSGDREKAAAAGADALSREAVQPARAARAGPRVPAGNLSPPSEVTMDTCNGSRPRAACALLAGCLVLAAPATRAAGDQAEQFTPEFRQPHTTFDAKHTPKIVAPDSVKRGEWFNVTVSVGAGGQHPSLAGAFVRYIALYKDTVEIARAYLHPVYSAPIVTFTIALDEGGSLRALEEPNHSSAWEATKKIVVVP